MGLELGGIVTIDQRIDEVVLNNIGTVPLNVIVHITRPVQEYINPIVIETGNEASINTSNIPGFNTIPLIIDIVDATTEDLLGSYVVYLQNSIFYNIILPSLKTLLCKKCKCTNCKCDDKANRCISYQNLMSMMQTYIYNIRPIAEVGQQAYGYEIYQFLQDATYLYREFIDEELLEINKQRLITFDLYYSEKLYKFYLSIFYLAAYFYNKYIVEDITEEELAELDLKFQLEIIKKCLPCELNFTALENTYLQINPDVPNPSTSSLHNDLLQIQGGTVTERFHLAEDEYEGIRELLHKNATTSLTISPSSGERGVNRNTNITLNIISNNDIITNAVLTGNNGYSLNVLEFVDEGSTTVNVGNLATTVIFTLTLTINRLGTTVTQTSIVTSTGIIPQWYGTSGNEDLSEEDYTLINTDIIKFLLSNPTISVDIAVANEYIYFISTKSDATISTGFPLTIGEWDSTTAFFIKKDFTLILANGTTTSNLTLYRTRELQIHSTINYTLS